MSSAARTDAHPDPQAHSEPAFDAARGRPSASSTGSSTDAVTPEATSCASGAGCGACSLGGAGGCGSAGESAAATAGEATAPVGCGAAVGPAPEPTWSDRASAKLSAVPPLVWAVAVGVLLVLGLVLAGALGAVLFALGALVIAGLAVVSWPRLSVPGRALRVAVLVFLLGVAVIRFVPA